MHPSRPECDAHFVSSSLCPIDPNVDPRGAFIYQNVRNSDDQFWQEGGMSMAIPPPERAQLSTHSTLHGAIRDEPDLEQVSMYGRRVPRVPMPPQAPQRQPKLMCVDLPPLEYNGGRSLRGSDYEPIYFRLIDGHEVPLSVALQGLDALSQLVGRDMPAPLGDVFAKISIRLHYEGCKPYIRQIMARRSTSGAETISMGNLARKIATEMKIFMDLTKKEGQPLQYQGQEIELTELVLLNLCRTSQGSWIPQFRIFHWVYD